MFVISRREGGFFVARYWLSTIYEMTSSGADAPPSPEGEGDNNRRQPSGCLLFYDLLYFYL